MESSRSLPDGRVSENGRSSESGPGSGSACEPHSNCLAYFITFHSYGSWLHGTERGSVDPKHNVPGTELLSANEARERSECKRLKHKPVVLDGAMRGIVEKAIREVCEYRGWHLRAVHVRTNHVHAVVTAKESPEKVMNDFKAYATRALGKAGLFPRGSNVWSRHGSTPYLWTEKAVADACRYVVEGQGAALPAFDARNGPEPRP